VEGAAAAIMRLRRGLDRTLTGLLLLLTGRAAAAAHTRSRVLLQGCGWITGVPGLSFLPRPAWERTTSRSSSRPSCRSRGFCRSFASPRSRRCPAWRHYPHVHRPPNSQ
jgi:hypothetical protein